MKAPDLRGILRWCVTICGAALGGGLAALIIRSLTALDMIAPMPLMQILWICAAATGVFATGCFFLSPRISARMSNWADDVERMLSDTPATQLLVGAIGLVFGLVIATLITQLFRVGLPELLWASFSAVVYIMLGYLGIRVATKHWREMPPLLRRERRGEHGAAENEPEDGATGCKILDTSVIIDGRIFDICKTGFVEGTLVIPQFVLAELRHIADSSDALRRNRGRRGLDVLAKIQKELDVPVRIVDTDYEEVEEVDVKLLKLAQALHGIVVTNDFNLNKVAGVTGVKVLNINDLANAIKPVLLPGEEMRVQVVREGKELGQGVGYLDDGTMIVVDNGRRHVGETIEVVVTTVLQTSAGRMIFTRIKAVEKAV